MKKLLSALLGIFGLFIVPAYAALPSGYTELEYIESTGTQYIDTGVIVDDMTYVFKSDFATTVHDTNVIFGTMNVSEGYPGIVVNASGSFRYGTQQIASSVDFAVGTKYSIELLYQNLKVDGTNYAASGTTNNTALTYPMFLFARNNVGTAGNFASVKMYSWQMYDNGTLKRNFVPAKDSSGKIGMYDTVGNRFYTNAGTGEFIAGDPVTDNSCRNLFDKTDNRIASGWYSVSAQVVGQPPQGLNSSITANTSAPISVNAGEQYTANYTYGSSPAWLFLDNNGNFISGLSNGNSGVKTVTVPTGAKYLLFPFDPSKIDEVQLELGSTATPYTPYNPLCATCNGTIVNYVSATGTVSQAGTPTPDNPIYPTFYKQGDMVLRKVGDIADSYDATTGKITRRVGEYIFTGRESIDLQYNVYGIATIPYDMNKVTNASLCSHNKTYTNSMVTNDRTFDKFFFFTNVNRVGFGVNDTPPEITNTGTFKQWLAAQYAAGTPVTIYYPLETETTEDWPASQCTTEPIKIATTKYNESAFGPLNTALANAISVVDTVVSNTITQAGRIATLQAQKQTRPADDTCPAYKQCLLVEDENGKPHWYEITDPFRDFVAPIIANNVAPASTTNNAGYTQLEYIRSDGASWIDTGITGTQDTAIETKFINLSSDSSTTVLIGDGWSNSSYLLSIVAQTGAPNRIGGLNNTLRDFWRTGQEFVVKMDKTGLYVNNSKINWNGSATNFTTTKPLYLLGDPAASSRSSNAKLYYMKIYNNGTLVRDFVPVKRNSDSAIGMYDTVSKMFFGNKGTGTFTAGPTVANTDVPANPTWTATWAANATTGVTAGTITGEGLCNGVSGTSKTPATSAQMSSANWSVDGASCWCRATGVDDGNDTTTVDGVWVFDYTYGSTGNCPGDCARDCTARINDTALFRKALLRM